MTPEQKARYEELSHRSLVKTIRPEITARLSNALQMQESAFEFFDRKDSDMWFELFQKKLKLGNEITLKNRDEAITAIREILNGKTGKCVFVGSGDFGSAGSISVDLKNVGTHLDELLRATGDGLSLISDSHDFGLCLCTQEGDDNLPYFLEYWLDTKATRI